MLEDDYGYPRQSEAQIEWLRQRWENRLYDQFYGACEDPDEDEDDEILEEEDDEG